MSGQDHHPIAADDDMLIVAYLDGQLPPGDAAALEQRLADDPDLRARMDLLNGGGEAMAQAFSALLQAAPADRLGAGLVAQFARDDRRPARWASIGRLAAAAVIGIGLLGVGYGLGRHLPASTPVASQDAPAEDWRTAVVEYAALYTPEIFLTGARDPSAATEELQRLGTRLAMALPADRLALPDLTYRATQIFNFDGAVLGQIAYATATGEPIIFCIIANSERERSLQTEAHGTLATASWAHGGYGYMLIGRLPPTQFAGLADTLVKRF